MLDSVDDATDRARRERDVLQTMKGSAADATKAHLPYLRFSFSKYTGEQGETFAERVLVEDSQALDTTKSVIVFANARSEQLTSQSLEQLLSKARW